MHETSPSSHSSGLDESDGDDFTAIARALDDWYTLLGRQFGPLSRPQRRMLRLLNLEKVVRVGDLAEALGLTTAGATRMLEQTYRTGVCAPYSRSAQRSTPGLCHADRGRPAGADRRRCRVSRARPGHAERTGRGRASHPCSLAPQDARTYFRAGVRA